MFYFKLIDAGIETPYLLVEYEVTFLVVSLVTMGITPIFFVLWKVFRIGYFGRQLDEIYLNFFFRSFVELFIETAFYSCLNLIQA